MSEEEAVVVFTARSPERIVKEGGSQAWVLHATRAKQCTWLVCTQNRNNPDHEFSDATEPHGAAFLIGRVSGVSETAETSKDGKKRFLVAISEFARVDVPNVWGHDRNPVRYLSRADLEAKGIHFDELHFQPMPKSQVPTAPTSTLTGTRSPTRPLTLAEARIGLAATFGVKPEAVEITIRG